MKHDSKSCKGEEKYLNLCLYYLEHSVIDYLLNSLDDVLGFCFVLTIVIQPTSLKEKPDRSQEEHGWEYLGVQNPKDCTVRMTLTSLFHLTPGAVCHMLVLHEALLTIFREKDLS